jgi:hypothetical protein
MPAVMARGLPDRVPASTQPCRRGIQRQSVPGQQSSGSRHAVHQLNAGPAIAKGSVSGRTSCQPHRPTMQKSHVEEPSNQTAHTTLINLLHGEVTTIAVPEAPDSKPPLAPRQCHCSGECTSHLKAVKLYSGGAGPRCSSASSIQSTTLNCMQDMHRRHPLATCHNHTQQQAHSSGGNGSDD